jgi:hypothetical protein
MPTITNKTRRPVSVPLPGGKKLFLGPGKSGQITPKAAEHAPLKKLVEAGELALDMADHGGPGGGSAGARKIGPSGGHRGTGGVRHTGDR